MTQYLLGYSGTSATEDLALAAPFLDGADLGCDAQVPAGGDWRKQVFELDLGVWTCVCAPSVAVCGRAGAWRRGVQLRAQRLSIRLAHPARSSNLAGSRSRASAQHASLLILIPRTPHPRSPAGFTLHVDTCASSALDTQLWVGTGCPASGAFTCFDANDNTPGCGGVLGWGSSVNFTTTVGTRFLYIIVGGAQPVGGAASTYAVNWKYFGVSWSSTATATPTGTQTASASVTGTPSSSETRSESPSATGTQAATTSPPQWASTTQTTTATSSQVRRMAAAAVRGAQEVGHAIG